MLLKHTRSISMSCLRRNTCLQKPMCWYSSGVVCCSTCLCTSITSIPPSAPQYHSIIRPFSYSSRHVFTLHAPCPHYPFTSTPSPTPSFPLPRFSHPRPLPPPLCGSSLQDIRSECVNLSMCVSYVITTEETNTSLLGMPQSQRYENRCVFRLE